MIYGTLAHWTDHKNCFPSCFSRALAFMDTPEAKNLADGTYEIEGRDIFVMVQSPATEPVEARKFELHREYIDIQLLVSGSEMQLYAPAPLRPEDAPLLEDKLNDADCAFYGTPAHHNAICLAPGEFAVYLPGELHCPNCVPYSGTPGTLKKFVFKIRKTLL